MDDIGNRQGDAAGVMGGILLAICILAVAAVLLLAQLGAQKVEPPRVASAATPAAAAQ